MSDLFIQDLRDLYDAHAGTIGADIWAVGSNRFAMVQMEAFCTQLDRLTDAPAFLNEQTPRITASIQAPGNPHRAFVFEDAVLALLDDHRGVMSSLAPAFGPPTPEAIANRAAAAEASEALWFLALDIRRLMARAQMSKHRGQQAPVKAPCLPSAG